MNKSLLRRILLSVTAVAPALVRGGCSDWPAFRHDAERTAQQSEVSPLSNPEAVKNLKCMWQFPDPRTRPGHTPHVLLKDGFRASPIVYKGRVFIGNGNGYFYALDANTG